MRFPRRPDPVLREVTVHVAPKEQVLLLGPSGAGKSTVLQVITGVVPHTITAELTGEITVAGRTTTDTSVVERARHLGVLPQDPAAAVCLPTVEQEVALPLENHATDPAAIDARVSDALQAAGAEHLRGRSTATLSGGECQRVALAAAIVTEPAMLLLDEPTSMLDAAGIGAVRGALATAAETSGAGMVLVEHRLDEWSDGLPARAVALSEAGDVVADGPTAQVLREHAAALHGAGCWLPLEAELCALTGADGALTNPVNTAWLESLAGPAPTDNVAHDTAPVLQARAVAVSHSTPRPRRRHTSGSAAVPVLSGIDLTVRAGETVALLGANGVGKTTLLLTLAGLLPPASGQIEGPRPGLVFQNPEHQFVGHTVREEIAHGLPPSTASELVVRQLRRHRLEHLADQSPFRLSGGEKRRLSLAAMLAHARPCLLADEPTLGLDRRDTVATVELLRQAAADGCAVVFSSHDLRTALTLADRVVLLGDGGVLAQGPPQQVLQDTAAVDQAGIAVPPLVAWLLEHCPGPGLRQVLRSLDAAVPDTPPYRPGHRAPGPAQAAR